MRMMALNGQKQVFKLLSQVETLKLYYSHF